MNSKTEENKLEGKTLESRKFGTIKEYARAYGIENLRKNI